MAIHEQHKYDDPLFRACFHRDVLGRGQSVLEHWHENAEILYIVKGALRIRADGEDFTAQCGSVATISSGAIHSLWPQNGDECVYYCLIIDNELLLNFGADMESVKLSSVVLDSEVVSAYERIIGEWRQKPGGYRNVSLALGCYLYLLLFNRFSKPQDLQADAKPVKEAISFMRQNFSKAITTSMLAARAGFNKSYFCRMFKKATGRTAMEYLHAIRCENARQLLRGGKFNISQSARMSGFLNMPYFTRTYLKVYGVLPSSDKKNI